MPIIIGSKVVNKARLEMGYEKHINQDDLVEMDVLEKNPFTNDTSIPGWAKEAVANYVNRVHGRTPKRIRMKRR